MIVSGGMRPPVPITVGAGRGFPVDSTETDGEVSSVVVRLPVEAPPGRNSWTRAFTVTASPTLTAGAEVLKTKMPSEVASSASGFGSCIQNPFVVLATTTPGTLDTTCPDLGEMCAAPWMSWIGVGGAGAAGVNVHVVSAIGWSGGSFVSWSDTWAAKTVTVQVSPAEKSVPGSSVNVVGPPLVVALCDPLVPHEIESQAAPSVTGSLNVTEMFAAVATSVAPALGVVELIRGAASAPA